MTSTNDGALPPASPTRIPSAFQEAIYEDIARGRGHTVVLARAGSGKTTTIMTGLAHVPRGLTVALFAFNKSIAEELGRRAPKGVEVKTLHSHGFSAVRRAFPGVVIDDKKSFNLLFDLFGVETDSDPESEEYDAVRSHYPDLAQLVRYAKDTLSVANVEALDVLMDRFQVEGPSDAGQGFEIDEYGTEEASQEIGPNRQRFLEAAVRLLQRSKEVTNIIDFSDMCWLPVVLGLRVWAYDRVFVDETQDLSPCQIALVLMCVKRGGRICAVGDDRQCHPAGTMIRTPKGPVPIERLSAGDEVIAWNQKTQRLLGKRTVVEAASRPYHGRLLRILTAENKATQVTPDHRLVVRWSSRDTNRFVTYLMWRRGYGFRVGWCQLFDKNAAFHLGHRSRVEKSDKTWILQVHGTRTDASVYESIVAAKWGIPTATFEPVHGAQHLTKKTIRKIFAGVAERNQIRGERCLKAHGRGFAEHLYPYPDREASAIGRRTLFQTYASNIIPEMMKLPSSRPDQVNEWTVVKAVQADDFEGDVYSLEVSPDATYVADGVVVHNCIYAFRGADTETVERLIEKLKAKVLPLSVTYRCPTVVVELARSEVKDFQAAPGAKEGEILTRTEDFMRLQAADGDIVISRANAPLLSACFAFWKAGKRARILGRDVGEGLLKLVKKSRATEVDELIAWIDERTAREISRRTKAKRPVGDLEDRAACIRTLAEEAKTVEEIVVKIKSLFADDPTKGVITLGTTHKLKGLEARRVWMLADTYRRARGGEEANCWYVAITRTQETLFLVPSKKTPVAT